MIMEFIDGIIIIQINVPTVGVAIAKAYLHCTSNFKLYNSGGYFISEYALFDGRYREVINEI